MQFLNKFNTFFTTATCLLLLVSADEDFNLNQHDELVQKLRQNPSFSQYEQLFNEEDIRKALATDVSLVDVRSISTTLNDYADRIFENVQKLMINSGLDPFQMPTVSESVLGIHLNLSNGWIQDISTIHRGGDVIVEYEPKTKILQVSIPIAFNSMQFTYDLYARWLLLVADGDITGSAQDVKVQVKLLFDLNTYTASLNKLDIHTGSLKMHIHSGHPLGDTFLNLIMDATTFLLKGIIEIVIDQIVGTVFRMIVNAINDFIQGILHPPASVDAIEILKRLITNMQ